MGKNINEIVDVSKLEYVYQPLLNTAYWNVYGYEGLVRFVGNDDFNPEELFRKAREEDCLFEMDCHAIKNSIRNFPLFYNKGKLLFINVFPSTLLNSKFEYFIEELVKEHSFIHGRIVFEISETWEEYFSWAHPELKEKIIFLKNHGFYVALDDVGKGAASLQNIIEYRPNYIKLDKYFAKDLAASSDKQGLVSLLTGYCNQKMILILEGIETAVDLAQAKLLKVPIVQGYLLGEPEKIDFKQPGFNFFYG
ncbi:diguanylate phosphodiesterase [Bacillus sp. V3-13]|uniref:EAL domain-containing protein n=1 Tax=Bacillus sp. V3-13 TaxID=2053728 RepID=UPI000C782810|nr:EAL domain-containing protein [Bacillus sp. V3-13]PLR78210.1 diguanylate phosphodiesterase [Bacillus sp. V3-13]